VPSPCANAWWLRPWFRRGIRRCMTDRTTLRLAATLLLLGDVLSLVAGILHPGRENPNDHPSVFAEYAQSASWTTVHLGQFIGMVLLVAGLLVLSFALRAAAGRAQWSARLGAIAVAVSLALYGVLQAIDGVALKQAVDAWARAPESEKAAHFAAAQVVRWLEWATRSYHSFVFGLALVLLATAIVWTARGHRLTGYLMGLSGLAYLVQGWILGSEGFSASLSVPQLLGYVLVLAWSIWLAITAWRTRESAEVVATRP
jgi:hypothetical protein